MTVLIAIAAAARNWPWQVWAGLGLLLAGGLYGCHEYDRGHDAAVTTITKSNERAKERADATSQRVEDCVGVWDRARGVCVLGQDGAGR